MSDKQKLSYCTYCGGEIELQYTIDVSIDTKVEVDGSELGFINDNYSLCSYECLYNVLEKNTDLYNTKDKVDFFKEELSNRHYRIDTINRGDKE
jgi:hypothetical protein